MDDQARAIGRRVRYWRLRRNLDRQRFADMVGRSTSWLDKIEKGERNLLRLPMLDRVAEVLNIDPAALTENDAARQTAGCVDIGEVDAMRAALSRYPSLSPTEIRDLPTFDSVKNHMEYVEQAWLSSNLTVVVRYLPRLMYQAQELNEIDDPENRTAISRILVSVYRLSCSVLLKFDANDVAWLAADRAMQTALAADDTVALARATRSIARSLTSTGQRIQAVDAIVGMTDRMRPDIGRNSVRLLSLYGMLFLAAEIAAAKNDDFDMALSMHRQALEAAENLDSECEIHKTAFGLANVGIHRVSALVRLHEPGRALEYANNIDQHAVARLPAERKVNHLFDLATARAETGQYASAARLLVDAETIAPQEVHCRPLARGLLRALLKNNSGDLGNSIKQLAIRSGVTV